MVETPDDADFLASLPPLVRAAAVGDPDEVRRHLRSGALPNEADRDGWTALHAAATRDHPAVVAELLEAGAEVDARSLESITPLWNASGPSRSGHAIRLLLEAGADPNAIDDRFGWSPLGRAADYGNLAATSLLIEFGADVRYADPKGFTLLMTAAEAGSTEIARLLLAAGADPTATCEGRTAARIALERGNTELARLLEA